MSIANAAVAGSTGLVGRELCLQLAREPQLNRVVALTRRPLDFSFSNLVEQRADFGRLDDLDIGPIDTAFSALGTTIKLAGTREAFRLVDFDYTVAFARFARKYTQAVVTKGSTYGVIQRTKQTDTLLHKYLGIRDVFQALINHAHIEINGRQFVPTVLLCAIGN